MINPEDNCTDLLDYLDERFYVALRPVAGGSDACDLSDHLIEIVKDGIRIFGTKGLDKQEVVPASKLLVVNECED